MAGLSVQLEERGAAVTVRLEGSFDAAAAVDLRKVIEVLGSKKVVLDFSGVRTFVDLAIGVLSRELEGQEIKLELLGLPGHHARLFHYMGLGSGPVPSRRAAYYQPEELVLH